jgi:nucleoside-diphosphate-sugar epimerase
MKVFLTGATGYIGSTVAEALQTAGHQVIGLARSEQAAQSLQAVGIEVVRGDLHHPLKWIGALDQVDGVIHTAATKDEKMPNCDRVVVEEMLSALSGTKKAFIYTSGTWILGHIDSDVNEQTPLNPIPLMAWRSDIERQVLAAKEHQIRSIVLRPGMVYGRGGGLVAQLVVGGRTNGVVQFVGTGDNHWALVHVEDLARCYVKAMEISPAGMVFNVVDECSLSLREIAQLASQAAGVSGRIQGQSLTASRQQIGLLADGLILNQQLSNTHVRQVLDWQPTAPSLLEEIALGSYGHCQPN